VEQRLDILAVDPWFGGSHEAFLRAWRERSGEKLELVGLADRQWKWRMRGGAWELARLLCDRRVPDVLVASDFLDLPAFFGLLPAAWNTTPTVLYMHENQLTYPVSEGAASYPRDTSYGFTNVLSCLRADVVVFNSKFHQRDFAAAADDLLKSLPKPNPRGELREKLARAKVIAPGVHLEHLPPGTSAPRGAPLRVLFSHRWEHDKDPRGFLQACLEARDRGADLELVLLGQRFGGLPRGVEVLLTELAPQVTHTGFLPSFADYAAVLGGCDLAVSTARHEFFGISTVEAMAAGVTPLLPDRLSYPELVGEELAPRTLYSSPEELVERLVEAANDPAPLRAPTWRARLRQATARWSVDSAAASLDTLCLQLRHAGALSAPPRTTP
jgi:glycosyltransferase involved in cell wall biosynthesis